jgi:hypothetical protein
MFGIPGEGIALILYSFFVIWQVAQMFENSLATAVIDKWEQKSIIK